METRTAKRKNSTENSTALLEKIPRKIEPDDIFEQAGNGHVVNDVNGNAEDSKDELKTSISKVKLLLDTKYCSLILYF